MVILRLEKFFWNEVTLIKRQLIAKTLCSLMQTIKRRLLCAAKRNDACNKFCDAAKKSFNKLKFVAREMQIVKVASLGQLKTR